MSAKRSYLTVYPSMLNGHPASPDNMVGGYGSEVWATSMRDAVRICRRRGLGEVVVGARGSRNKTFDGLSVVRTLRSRAPMHKKVHALCWLGLLATSAKVATAADFFDDEVGIIHQLAHHWGNVVDRRDSAGAFRAILKKVARIERSIPGYARDRRLRVVEH